MKRMIPHSVLHRVLKSPGSTGVAYQVQGEDVWKLVTLSPHFTAVNVYSSQWP